MGTFTLTQEQKNKISVFRPNADINGCVNWREDVYRNTHTITVRPDGDSSIQFSPFPGTGESNYQDVDEVVADDDTTYTYYNTPLQQKFDRYSFTIPAAVKVNSAPVSIKVYARMRRAGAVDGGNLALGRGVGTPGGDNCSWGALGPGDQAWHTYDKTFTNNPDTGNLWTWAELEAATLCAGIVTNNGDGGRCTQMYAVITYRETSPHYARVDEEISDEDDSYVYWNEASVVSDLYGIPNHITETGTINYVQIFAEAKSNEFAPHVDTKFNILCSPDSTCSITYKSNDISLLNQYTKYQHVWTQNPATSAAWTWSDIDALAIGAETYVHAVTVNKSKTIRPIANGDVNGLSGNYTCVDEEIPDGMTSIIYDAAQCGCTGNKYSIFINSTGSIIGLPNTIYDVTVFVVVKKNGDCDGGTPGDQDAGCETCKEVIKIGGVEYRNPTSHSTEYTWKTYSYSWAQNPNTLANWTWLEVANTQIGVEMQGMNCCTQVYAIVSYTDTVYPDVRLTQSYAKVVYDSTVVCHLPKPDHVSTNHARNVKMLNFWNGEREVYDLNRSGKSMVLTGEITDRGDLSETWCDTSYAFRKKITIDHDQVDGNLVNFPVYVDANLNGKCLNANGYDVMFCDSSCSEYSCEIENYSSDGKLKAWVKIPTVSSTVDTVFWIYYKKTGVTTDPSTTDTWNTDYKAVYHMTDDPDSSHIKDSTQYGNHGTKFAADNPKQTKSLLYKGQKSLSTRAEAINCGHDASLDVTEFTIETWINMSYELNVGYCSLWKKNAYSVNLYSEPAWNPGLLNAFQGAARAGGINYYSNTYVMNEYNTWQHVVITAKNGEPIKLYINGVFRRSHAVLAADVDSSAYDLYLCYCDMITLNDEMRVNGKCQTIEYIKACYDNQKENSTFIVYGRQQENYVDIINACNQIICVRDMARNGSIITINKLVPLYFSGDYRINSFGWDKVSSKPENYRWILELEDAD
jgi:hypothetical protein